MSFTHRKTLVEEGDLLLAWIRRDDIRPIRVTKGEVIQTRYGGFKHDSFIGRKYGSQLACENGPGFIHIMAPTPELWMQSLPHRTQIVYSPDASYICDRLRIVPGTRIIEAGTGSGALTHVFARAVGNAGLIYTFEYHQARSEEAKRDFQEHGLGDRIRVTHRNVCQDSFDMNEPINASAVFLDLPSPWLAVPLLEGHLDRTQQARICCFSPCIEQVIKTVQALQKSGFRNIEMVENQARRWEGHWAMHRSVEDAMNVLRDVRARRQEGLDRRHGRLSEDEYNSLKRKRDAFNPWGRGLRVKEGQEGYQWDPVSWTETTVKSHTSYLTFATLPPAS